MMNSNHDGSKGGRLSGEVATKPALNTGCNAQAKLRVLVTYASQYGATRELAEFIAKVLGQGGADVTVMSVADVKNLKDYQAVIIGSAIQYDKWLPAATKFVTRNQSELSKLPVAYFFTCLTLAVQNKKAERQAQGYADKLKELLPEVTPISVGQFAGALDSRKLPFFLRLILKLISAVVGVRDGDYRDWEPIRSWAKDVYSKFTCSVNASFN